MKQLFSIAILGALLFSCGEEGVGFNARKEIGVPSEMSIPSAPDLPLDPPKQERDITFDLEDVTGDLDQLDEVILNGLSYKITGIDPQEELDVVQFTVTLNVKGSDVLFLDLTTLANTSNSSNDDKINIDMTDQQLTDLQEQIFGSKKLNGTVILELEDFPDQDLEFEITTYFDVTAKIRDL